MAFLFGAAGFADGGGGLRGGVALVPQDDVEAEPAAEPFGEGFDSCGCGAGVALSVERVSDNDAVDVFSADDVAEGFSDVASCGDDGEGEGDDAGIVADGDAESCAAVVNAHSSHEMKGSTSGRGGQPGKDGGNRSPSPAARRRARAAIAEKQKTRAARGWRAPRFGL